MAVVKMNKLYAAGFKSTRAEFLKELMALGFTEIDPTEIAGLNLDRVTPETAADEEAFYDNKAAEAENALKAIIKYGNTKAPFIVVRKPVKSDEFEADILNTGEKAEKTAAKINSLVAEIEKGQSEINRLRSIAAGLEPWKELEIDLSVDGTKNTAFMLGTLPVKTDFDFLLKTLEESLPTAIVNSISQDKQFRYIYAFSFRRDKDELLSLLRKHNFNLMGKNALSGTPTEIINRCAENEKKQKELIENSKKVIADLVSEKEIIESYHDGCALRRDRLKIVSNMVGTGKVFYFEGWIPEAGREKTEKLFEKYGYYCEIREPLEDEEPPVMLQNNAVVTPFESITEMYSLPSKNDIDPTKFLAPFYFIFFGMMLSDAAYGLIMSAGCWFAIKKFKLEGSMYRMIKMFFYCGISTFIWGALFGGWFGDFFTVAAKTLFNIDFVIKPLWFAPMDEPMKLLIFSLILGGVHLFVGMGIQAYILIRDGKPLDALFDIGFWYMVLLGLVAFGVLRGTMPAAAEIGKYAAIAGAIGIIATGGRAKKGIFGKITGGLGSLYGITGYLSDILSYSRLLALGLATGVVSSVINMLGSLMGGGVLGAIVLMAVFIAGHAFNISINALGSFVHSCRLQYVEFFGKFYTGGGKPFKPFFRDTKYVKIVEEEKQ